MEISNEPIPQHTMYIKFDRNELRELASDAAYILANVELSTVMRQLLRSLMGPQS